MINPLQLCDFDPGRWLVIGPNVGPLQYYSHLPVIIISLILGFYILAKNRRGLANQALFVSILSFVAWVFFDSVIWATNRSDVIMFMWSLQILIEPIVYIASLTLLYALVDKRAPSFANFAVWFGLFIPLILIVPTKYSLSSFDLSICLANETYFSYYSYLIEAFFVCWILYFAVNRYLRATSKEEKRYIDILASSVMLFLIAFAWGNVIGSLTEDWELAQYGLFGMPIFTAMLVYCIVRFGTFNIQLLGAVSLVFALWGLILSLLFVRSADVFQGVAGVTLLVAIGFGLMLIRSIAREARQRRMIEEQRKELEVANQQQESLLHFISHEVKGYLADGQNALAGIVEGDFGEVPTKVQEISKTALGKVRAGVATVMDILDASNLKRGTMQYKHSDFDFKEAVQTVLQDLTPLAEAKNLHIETHIENEDFAFTGDEEKFKRHVIRNLVDNAIRYTPSGSVTISLSRQGNVIRFETKDSGVGITPEDMHHLFTEGGKGKDSLRTNVNSTGYGLFVAKSVVDAHGGNIWAESEGQGKGATFIVELPVSK